VVSRLCRRIPGRGVKLGNDPPAHITFYELTQRSVANLGKHMAGRCDPPWFEEALWVLMGRGSAGSRTWDEPEMVVSNLS